MDISYDRYSLLLEGQRTFIRSGAMHYFRLPSQALWRDRLFKLKAAGYNTVDFYFCWAYHSPQPGVYDFTGIRDVQKLLEITQELGLYVIARPGPYINAEYTGGGLPGWLLARKDVILRHRHPDGQFEWSEPYMEAVREWWEHIIPFLRNQPNILMVQIENEYATLEMEPEPIQALYDLTRSMGITVPLMHNDMYAAGLYEDLVDLYAFDNYSVTHFDGNWRTMDGIFSVLDGVEQNLRPFCQNRPLMVAELQAGWFGGWKGNSYERIIEHLGRDHIQLVTKTLIAQGLTIFNHYKAIGGTNWGTIGSTDTYTSYDFGAPISEAGLNTERLFEAKAINALLSSFNFSKTHAIETSPVSCSHPEHVFSIRQSLSETGEGEGHWFFLRNLSQTPQHVELENHFKVIVQPSEMLMIPHRVPLQCGYTLLGSTVEPLYQTEKLLILKGDRPIHFHIQAEPNLRFEASFSNGDIQPNPEGWYGIFTGAMAPAEHAWVQVGDLTVYLLGASLIDTFWALEDNTVVVGPNARLSQDQWALDCQPSRATSLLPGGNIEILTGTSDSRDLKAPSLPILKDWEVISASPELTTSEGFSPVSPEGADFDTNGFYEGSAWYRYAFTGDHYKLLTLDARHIWAVFLNGHLVGEGHHWGSISEEEPPSPQRYHLQREWFNRDGENELVILVDGLGHSKGFHDDAQHPQGVLLCHLDHDNILPNLLISPGFRALQKTSPDSSSPHSPLLLYKTQFTLPDLSAWECPIGLRLNNLPYERINIYLNNTLIGRHWKACQSQSLYFLPEGILNTAPDASNEISLLVMNFHPLLSVTDPAPSSSQVQLQLYGVFTKLQQEVKLAV